ncbi:NUDIX hydrolase [Glaciibacter sp. 2TAF33]|uniref:NUDIX hydrolase n=1 Tax=Glaciibacter sp. 2TAF33 TaxID=3233015 RepID=UPI003F928FB5
MDRSPRNARYELQALCSRGLDWAVGPERTLPDRSLARRAAVLVLFGVLDPAPAVSGVAVARDLDVLLQRRSDTMGHHAGQIGFPGGGVEASDADLTQTALREAVEETGLDPAGVDVLGTLPPLAIPASNNLVTPVPAWWARTSEVAAVDHREAIDVFRMPVADLLEPAHRQTLVFRRGAQEFRSPAFTVGDVLVWGFTALVLDRMFDAMNWAVPWDRERTLDLPPAALGR